MLDKFLTVIKEELPKMWGNCQKEREVLQMPYQNKPLSLGLREMRNIAAGLSLGENQRSNGAKLLTIFHRKLHLQI